MSEATEPKKEEVKPANLIAIDQQTREVAPADHVQLMAYIKTLIVAKSIPKHLENAEQVLSAWNFAAQLGLPPQPSLRQIAVIKGTPSLFGELPLALVQKHPDFLTIEEFVFDDKYTRISYENGNAGATIFGAVCFLHRRGMEKPQSFMFTWDDATRAGINALKTERGGETVWAKYPQIMLVRRARSLALKSLFADAITGASISEDEHNIAPDLIEMRDVKPSTDKADLLNNSFRSAGGTEAETQAQ